MSAQTLKEAIANLPTYKPRPKLYTVANAACGAAALADAMFGNLTMGIAKDVALFRPVQGRPREIDRAELEKLLTHVLSNMEFVEKPVR